VRSQRRSLRFLAGVLLFVCIACAGLAPPVQAQQKSQNSGSNPRYAAIVIDAHTGEVLHARHADKVLHPASLVKMMTLLMAFEGLQNGTLTLNQRLRISNYAAEQPPSKIGLRPGSSITVKDAIHAIVTKSANDISVAMAEGIAGTESQFVYRMNQRAKELGMTRTRFQNANGLHHPQQVSTARDMAILSRHLILNYPAQYRYFSVRNFYYNGANYHNHNRLMESYDGMDGIKTGFINASGFNLAASAVRGDTRLIAVVFGGRTAQSRNAHVRELLDQNFAKLGKDRTPAPRIASATSNARIGSVPLPARKPGSENTVLAANQNLSMNEWIGEGDLDPAAQRRFETGMMAVAAVKGETTPGQMIQSVPQERLREASFNPATALENADEWSIQIGAFSSRVSSDQALDVAMQRLPAAMKTTAVPVIVPLKAGDGWVYRARIRGLNREQAVSACKYFQNCMAISPRAY
jgi:D-alanyl-D-alanine carboxypeptidase